MRFERIWLSLILVTYLSLPTAWGRDPRRDVGLVEDPIGRGVTRIFPRAELNEPNAGRIAGPSGSPNASPVAANVAQEQLSLGPPVGAQVPFSAPRSDMPGAAFEPLPADARQRFHEQRGAVPAAPAAGQPALSMNPQPVAPSNPVVAAPIAMTPVIQVAFSTPNTGSTFIPANAAVPAAVVQPTAVNTSVLSPAAGPTGMRLAPNAPPTPGAAAIPANSFLSAQDPAALRGFRLQPSLNPTPPVTAATNVTPQGQAGRKKTTSPPATATPGADPLAELLSPPKPKGGAPSKENKLPPLDLPAPPAGDGIDPTAPLFPGKPPGVK